MQKLLTINNFGSVGINQDVNKSILPPEIFTEGINFRLFNGNIETFNGEVILGRPPTDINAANIIWVSVDGSNYYILLGLHNIIVTDGLTYTNISSLPSSAYPGLSAGDEYKWNWSKLGTIPIINNVQHFPEYWSPQSPSQIFQPLNFRPAVTWSTAGKKCKIIRSHKNFLFALGLNEGGTDMPYAYRWSHPADINGLPYTWDETDLAAIAGISQVSGDYGVIVDGLSLRDNFCIYTQNAIVILSYIGGEFVWNARPLTTSYGLLAQDCVVEVNGVHYFISEGDVLRNDGSSITSLLHNRMRTRIASSISSTYSSRSFAVANYADKEIWFCLVEEGFDMPNLAIIYNWEDDNISLRELTPTLAKLTYAPILQGLVNAISEPWSTFSATSWGSEADPWNMLSEAANLTLPITWQNTGLSWDDYTKNWDYSSVSPFSKSLVGVSPLTSDIVAVEYYTPGTTLDTYIARESFVIEDQRQVKMVTKIYPHMQGIAPLEISVGAQDYTGGPISWSDPITFTPNRDRAINVRSTGKLHSWKFASIGSGTFTLSGMDIEYTLAGRR